MMQERNILQNMLGAGIAVFTDFIEPIMWFFFAALCLILADLKFGIEAAKFRGENIRTSRAVRRSVNKAIDYLCWILVAMSFGKVFGEPFGIPILPTVVLLTVYGCEINSCFNNYFEARGKEWRVNVFKLFKSKSAEIIEPEKGDSK